MSAVLEPTTEPDVNQLPLIPTLAPAPEPEMIRLSAWGRLTRQAEVRVATDGSGMLIVEILQGKNAMPFVAIRHEPADQINALRDLAHEMRPGVAVVIIFRGFEVTTHRGQEVLSPRICDVIGLSNFSFVNPDGSTT